MKTRRFLVMFVAGTMLSIIPAGGAKADIHFDSGSLYVFAGDGTGDSSDMYTMTGLDLDYTHNVSRGLSSNVSTYAFESDAVGSQWATLDFSLTQSRDLATGSHARGTGVINFTLTDETHYSLSGDYELVGPPTASLWIAIADSTWSQRYVDMTQSAANANESLVFGPLEGTLQAGSYTFLYDYWLDLTWQPETEIATTEGHVSFDLQTQPVPLPAGVFLGMLGLGVTGMKLRKYV